MEAIPNRVIELVEIRPGRRICVERAWPTGVQALHAAVPRADSAGEVDSPPSGSSIDAKHGDVGTQSSSRLALVFIHGSLARRTQFEAQFEAFRHTHPCVRYDFLGCGDSDKPDVWDAYAEEETVADAVEVVRRYAGARCVLVGHSFGSNVAAQLAVHPDLQPIVRGVVGIGAANVVAASRAVFHLPAVALELMREKMNDAFLSAAFHGSAPADMIAAARADCNRNPWHVIRPHYLQMKWRSTECWPRVAQPCCFIVGEADRITPPSNAEAAAAAVAAGTHAAHTLPPPRVHVVAEAAHQVMQEQPAAVNAILTEFLDAIDSS